MVKLFKFPDYFGRTVDALIDCLFSLRSDDNRKPEFHIKEDECILLEVIGFSESSQEIKNTLTAAIELVSLKCTEKNQNPSIVLLLNARG